MSLIATILTLLLAPLPRPMVDSDITDAELIAHVWEMSWGHGRQTCYFCHDGQSLYYSPQYGGGTFILGKNGRVEFEEGQARYVMVLRRIPEGLVGTGWCVCSMTELGAARYQLQ